MSTITLEHWCPGLDWWDFEDDDHDISALIRTMMITLENYQWRVFDLELHDAVGGEKQSWELSRCWTGFLIVNIAIIFRTLLKYCECPDYIAHIVIIFWTQLQYCEYRESEVSENSRSREFSRRAGFIFSRSTTRNDFLKSRSRSKHENNNV